MNNDGQEENRDTYQACTVEQLKTKLRDRNLRVSGSKSQLIERLIQSNKDDTVFLTNANKNEKNEDSETTSDESEEEESKDDEEQ